MKDLFNFHFTEIAYPWEYDFRKKYYDEELGIKSDSWLFDRLKWDYINPYSDLLTNKYKNLALSKKFFDKLI
jgi:hypothetical protein